MCKCSYFCHTIVKNFQRLKKMLGILLASTSGNSNNNGLGNILGGLGKIFGK